MSIQTCGVAVNSTTIPVANLRCAFVVNGVGDCTFEVTTPSGSYTPTDGESVEITLGGSSFWKGEVVEFSSEFLGPSSGTRTVVTAHDLTARLRRALHNQILTAGSLESMLVTVTDPGGVWNDVGLTLDAAQPTGPTLETVTAAWTDGESLANYLAALSGYLYRVDSTGAVKFWAPGSVSSGVTLSLANANVEHAAWSRDRFDYINRAWVVYGPAEVLTVSDPFNGDGVTRDFHLRYRVASAPGSITLTDGMTTVVQPVGVYGVDTSMEWTYDAATGPYGAIRQKNTFTVLSSSWLLTAEYASQFPNYVFADDAADVALRGQWNGVVHLPDVTDVDEATAAGEAAVRRGLPRADVASITTRTDGITAGSTVAVSLSAIGLSATMLVQRVDVQFVKAEDEVDPYYTLSLVEGDELSPVSAALFQRMVGGVSSTASVSAAAGSTTTTILSTAIEGDLGGTRLNGVTHSTWAPVREHREWRCPAAGDYVAHVEVWTSSGSTSVTPRVYDITSADAAVTGSSSTSTTAAKQSLTFTGVEGHDYRLELLPGNSSNDVFGLGKVRA